MGGSFYWAVLACVQDLSASDQDGAVALDIFTVVDPPGRATDGLAQQCAV
jgi:hypothetical protein